MANSKYSLELAHKAAHKIELTACTHAVAAAHIGISYKTWTRWLANKPEFKELIALADAKAEDPVANVMYTLAVGGSDRIAAQYLLENRFNWGNKLEEALTQYQQAICEALQGVLPEDVYINALQAIKDIEV